MHAHAIPPHAPRRDERRDYALQCLIYPDGGNYLLHRQLTHDAELQFWKDLLRGPLPHSLVTLTQPGNGQWTLECDWDGPELLALLFDREWPVLFFAVARDAARHAECWSTLMSWLKRSHPAPAAAPWMLILPYPEFQQMGAAERMYFADLIDHLAWAFHELKEPRVYSGEPLNERLQSITGYTEYPLASAAS